MPSKAAQIRAGITKVVLDHRSSLSADERERFEAAIGAEAIARIEAKFNTTMIASAEHVAIVEALRAILGGERLQEYFADAYVDGFSKIPLLRSLVEATLRTFGASPGHMAKVTPRAWNAVATETGEFTVEVDDAGKRAVLRLTSIDPALAGEGAYADTFAGTFVGFLRQCRVEGEVEITEIDRVAGTATFEMRWR